MLPLVLHLWSIPWLTMVLMAIGTFAALKWATLGTSVDGANGSRRLGYLLAWPGMDARAFLTMPSTVEVARQDWGVALARTLAGAVLFWGVARSIPESTPVVVGLVGMAGLLLMLHFGAFQVLALVWQVRGVTARPIMEAPWRAVSLADFWGQRWNRAFRDVAHQRIFRPLAPRIGATGAMFAVFLVSGVIHDLVISIPAGSGFGLPTAYFLLQGIGCAGERMIRARFRRAWGTPWGRGVARAGTALFVLGPVLWLFHPPFLTRVIVPLMHAAGAMT